jgi:NAD(P)-dependent dehydrogenase (short-subunit alcohol dehydrogenase family)
MDLANEAVIVTGAAGNLGRAVARAFAARGASLFFVDQRRDLLEQAFGGEDERRAFGATDLLDQSETDRVAKQAVERFGRVDVLCNLTGGFRMGEAVHETSDATWEFLIGINARTLLGAVRAVVPHMIAARGGRIVNVGAYSGRSGRLRDGRLLRRRECGIRLTERCRSPREGHQRLNCVMSTTSIRPRTAPRCRAPSPGHGPSIRLPTSRLLASKARRTTARRRWVTGLGWNGRRRGWRRHARKTDGCEHASALGLSQRTAMRRRPLAPTVRSRRPRDGASRDHANASPRPIERGRPHDRAARSGQGEPTATRATQVAERGRGSFERDVPAPPLPVVVGRAEIDRARPRRGMPEATQQRGHVFLEIARPIGERVRAAAIVMVRVADPDLVQVAVEEQRCAEGDRLDRARARIDGARVERRGCRRPSTARSACCGDS